MKSNKITKLQITLYAFSAVIFLYGVGVFLIIGGGYWFNYIGMLGGALLFAYASLLPWLKKHKVLLSITLTLLGIFLAFTSIFIGLEVKYAMSKPIQNAKYCIVLGAKVKSYGPSLEFAKRLDLAAEYLKENPDTIVLLTGGKGSNEADAESEGGKKYLLSKGIEEGRILTEAKSFTTEENFLYAEEVINKNGGSKEDRIVVISSAFHLYRAHLLAEDQGYSNLSYSGSTGLVYLLPYYYFREFAAFVFASV